MAFGIRRALLERWCPESRFYRGSMAAVVVSEQWRPQANPWLIAATVALAAFMEVLDTSIANVALPHIVGDLGASTSQGTWVLNSYLVSNAIIGSIVVGTSIVIRRR